MSYKRFFVLCWITMFLAWIPCFLAYYPVLFNYDVINQYTQIVTGEYNQHHPLVHTLLCQAFYRLGKVIGNINSSFALYSLFQMLCLSGVLSYGLLVLRQKDVKVGWQAFTFLWCTFFLMNPIMALSITKDTLFSVFALMTFLLILQMDEKLVSKSQIVTYAVSLMLMVLLRNNAKYSVTILVMLITIFAIKDIKSGSGTCYLQLGLVSFVSLLLAIVINGAISKKLDAEPGNPREMLCVPMQQVACVYVEDREELLEELTGDDIDLLYRCCSKEFLEHYHSEYADYVKLGVNFDTIKNNSIEVAKLYIKIGMKHPGKYIKAFGLLTQGYWNPFDTTHAYIYDGWAPRQGYLLTDMKYMEEIKVEHKSLLPSVEKFYELFATDNVQYSVPILYCVFVPAFYIWIFVLSIIRMKKNRLNVLATTITFAYLITTLFGPGCVPRYSYSVILCSMFFMPITFGNKNEKYEFNKIE